MKENYYNQIKVSQGSGNQTVVEMQMGPVFHCMLNFTKFKSGHCSWEEKKKSRESLKHRF